MPRAPQQVLVLPYRRRATLEVAVLHRTDYDVWQFVSGGVEEGEVIEAAARREGMEEAGIVQTASYRKLDAVAMLPACWFPAWATWPEHVLLVPEYSFAVETDTVTLSAEHDDVRWLGYADAIALLRFDSNRTALWELRERLYPGARCKRNAFTDV
jgi:dATP pyrophosphohydrolase